MGFIHHKVDGGSLSPTWGRNGVSQYFTMLRQMVVGSNPISTRFLYRKDQENVTGMLTAFVAGDPHGQVMIIRGVYQISCLEADW